MSNEVADLATDMRELDRRVAQLQGAFAVLMSEQRAGPPKLP